MTSENRNNSSGAITKEYYDDVYYKKHSARLHRNDRFTKVKVLRMLTLLRPQSGELILDLGSGVGTIMTALSRTGVKAVGLDYSWRSLVLAKQYFSEKVQDRIFRGVCCDGKNIAIKDGSLDGIAAVDFTEHLDDAVLLSTLLEAYRILKKGGRLVIHTPSRTHLFEALKRHNIILKEDKSHVGLRAMKEYRDMLAQTGFLVKEAYFKPTHIPLLDIMEAAVMNIPVMGDLAKRRICICAEK